MNDGGDYMDRDWIIKTVVVEEWKKMGGYKERTRRCTEMERGKEG